MAAPVACLEGQAEPRQLPLFNPAPGLAEARHYHPPATDPDFPFLSWNFRDEDEVRMHQRSMPVARLPWLIAQIGTRPSWRREHHFVSQHEFKAPNRQALNLWRLGLLWADLDLLIDYAPPAEIARWTSKAICDCAELNIPEPSAVIWSGRGLHLKWFFHEAVPAQALPRWAACMAAIKAKLESKDWPYDKRASDVSRILRIVGTINPRRTTLGQTGQRPVYVTFEGRSYHFEVLAEQLLPYSRDEVQQFREDAKARAEAEAARRAAWEAAHAEWAQFDANRRAAASMLSRTVDAAAQAAGEAAQGLWWHRLDVLRQVAANRGGIAQGERNEWLWIAANALAWGLGDAGKLWLELPQLAREIAPTLTIAEARNSASSVYQRLKQGGRDGLYRLKTDTLVDRLGLTTAEAAGLRGSGHGTKNPGAMGLPKLSGLTFEEWQAETRLRFAAGAGHATATRPPDAAQRAQQAAVEARLQATESKRAAARKWRSAGMGLSAIAFNLDVSVATVHRWCKDQF